MLTTYNKEIRSAKRSSFRAFCESITDTPAAARMHRAMARNKVETNCSMKKPDGSYTENEEQKALLLLETHFPGSVVGGEPAGMERRVRAGPADWRIAAAVCTEQRVNWAIGTFQPFKSPGVDGIIPALLQRGREEVVPHLVRIFRSSLALGYIPRQWRRARVIFIPKMGRKDTTNPKASRPISLTSFMLKTMKKVVAAGI